MAFEGIKEVRCRKCGWHRDADFDLLYSAFWGCPRCQEEKEVEWVEEIECGTFSNKPIPENIRKRMDADRAEAERKQRR
jgi:Zn ribbon nucleic-acid-binding protein